MHLCLYSSPLNNRMLSGSDAFQGPSLSINKISVSSLLCHKHNMRMQDGVVSSSPWWNDIACTFVPVCFQKHRLSCLDLQVPS